jgi:transposase-like protein
MNKIKERRRVGATCPKCKSPDYKYTGRTFDTWGKHNFECKSCGNSWQYGSTESKYTRLA